MELTDRSRAIYDTLDRPWDQAANWLFAARAAISAGDATRSVEGAEQVQRWLRTVDDPWLHVRGEAMLGELARLQRRFDDAVAAHRSRRGTIATARLPADRGLPGHEPRPSAVPGRRLRGRLGHLATRDRQGPGHRRRAACRAGPGEPGSGPAGARRDRGGTGGTRSRDRLAPRRRRWGAGRARRVPAGRHGRRGSGAGRRGAPGGDPRRGPTGRTTRPSRSSPSMRSRASRPHVGDAGTARALCEAADRRMEAAAHFITDLDRTDAHCGEGPS